MGEWGVGFDVRARARASASASESDAGARVVRCGVVFASDARTPTPCALAPTSKGEHAVLTMDVLGDVDARLRARAREDGDEEESEACVRHFGCVLAGAHFAKKADRGRKRKAPPGSKRRRRRKRERDEGRCVEGTVSTAREIRAGTLSRPDALRVERVGALER